ncbi:MAG: hypothetical protein U0P45_03305 [Acidimicrobiales bacterium]
MTHDDPFVRTRLALHAVAEHLLAGDLHRTTGRIGLRRTPGGFGQPEHQSADGQRRRLRIEGTSLVVLDGDVERWRPLTTLAAAAEDAGTTLGTPAGVYEPETSPDPAEALDLDVAAAARLAEFYAFVEEVLEEVRSRHAHQAPAIVQLWPEHFDLACNLGEVNLGGSPGDAGHDEPYLYVGPWTQREGAFWNEPWGAGQPWSAVPTVDAAVAFLVEGLAEAGVR